MRVEASDYLLQGVSGSGRERSGSLLRVSWGDGAVGFADLHTWPEVGQPSVHELLQQQSGKLWDLALQASRRDAKARATKAALPRSARQHRLWMSTWDLSVGRLIQTRRDGFGAIKLKLDAGDLPAEARRLAALVGWWGDELRLRLDLNSRGEPDALARFLWSLPCRLRELIDYIEDPFPFAAASWQSFAACEGVSLAWDQPTLAKSSDSIEEAEVAAREQAFVRIWKPLWESEPIDPWQRVVVTSSLGHPLGSLWAASEATRKAPAEIHGCASHLVYKALPGFEVRMCGDRLAEPERGTSGLGFEASLARLVWREVASS